MKKWVTCANKYFESWLNARLTTVWLLNSEENYCYLELWTMWTIWKMWAIWGSHCEHLHIWESSASCVFLGRRQSIRASRQTLMVAMMMVMMMVMLTVTAIVMVILCVSGSKWYQRPRTSFTIKLILNTNLMGWGDLYSVNATSLLAVFSASAVIRLPWG